MGEISWSWNTKITKTTTEINERNTNKNGKNIQIQI